MRFLPLVLFASLTLNTHLFAITPYSLEGLQAVNVTILNKNKLLTDALKKELQNEIEQKLTKAGIQTSTTQFSNFLVHIKEVKIAKTAMYHIALSLGENVRISRAHSVEGVAMTYHKEEIFESSNPEADIKESIGFLVDEFLEQYKEENSK